MSILNSNNISKASELIVSMNGENVIVKREKKDNGLLERTEPSKVILTEDNRQVILG